jgi:hypothetical protein
MDLPRQGSFPGSVSGLPDQFPLPSLTVSQVYKRSNGHDVVMKRFIIHGQALESRGVPECAAERNPPCDAPAIEIEMVAFVCELP